ncbi:hypothetical protein AB0953_21465 [Streptomyces sp. NPDC046866]|uniref:hypothetical protein n=1 Tax=Streptomyces sp. NPDC046866 TaxID=3154921 RepID=UPI0034527051
MPALPAVPALAAVLALLGGAGLTGCAALQGEGGGGPGVRYSQDYERHEPLRVEGYPSAGSLRVVQEVVWRIGDGEAGALAALGSSDSSEGERERAAKRWVAQYRGGAAGPVTAAFCETGPAGGRQVVALRFAATGQTKVLHVRLDGPGGESGWRVRLPAQDTAEPPPSCP